MNLRCRVGDLAVVVHAPAMPEMLGRFLTVLYAAPRHDHRLPDGMLHGPTLGDGRWVVEFQREIDAPIWYYRGGTRRTRYAVVMDRCLRPIRPDADPVERDEPVEASTC